MENVPTVVKRRINALKNLQLKLSDAELKLYEEINQLECKYSSVFEPLYNQREKIVNGEHEPTDEEANWPYKDEESDEDDKEINGSAAKKQKTEDKNGVDENCKGLPDFWLKVFRSTSLLASMVQEHDEPILKHLRDVRVRLHDKKPYGYTIEFHFNENEYFTNKVLTKTYELTTDRDEKNPLMNDTTKLYKCLGTKIEWNEGKNVTFKVVKKNQKNKSNGNSKEVTKEEKQGSFFDLFDTHTVDGVKPSFKVAEETKEKKEVDEEDMDEEEELEHLFDLDFEIGQFFKDVLVPKALLYYTGELNEAVDDDFDEDDDDDDEDDDEESEGEDGKKN